MSAVFRIDSLPDCSIPARIAKHGSSGRGKAAFSLKPILMALRPDKDDALILRYAYDPLSRAPRERSRLYLAFHIKYLSRKDPATIPCSHVLRDFYALTPSSAKEAAAPLKGASTDIFLLKKREETLFNEEKDRFYCAWRPFASKQNAPLDTILWDAFFDDLRAPAIVDVAVKPYEMSVELTQTLFEEIKELEGWSSETDPDKRDAGRYEDFIRERDLLAARHKKFNQQNFDDFYMSQSYLYAFRVLSKKPEEGHRTAQFFADSFFPDGECTVDVVPPDDQEYGACRKAIETLRFHVPADDTPLGISCLSKRLARLDPKVVRIIQKRFLRAARLSELSHCVGSALASRMLSLPASEGRFLRTIRMESEIEERKLAQDDKVQKIELGDEMERPGRTSLYIPLLTRHLFLGGSSGGGKSITASTICGQLWERYNIPFLLLVPIADPYRILLHAKGLIRDDLRILTPGDDRLSPMRLNFFEVEEGATIENHISHLMECFSGAIEMFGPLEGIFLESLEQTYRLAGFKPSDPGKSDAAWPTMKDFVKTVRRESQNRGYVGELKQNILAAIENRLVPLRKGVVGRALSSSVTFPSLDDFLKYPTIVEMEHLTLEQQNLLILFLLSAVQRRLNRLGPTDNLRLLIGLEEAHNLISAQNASGKASESGADPCVHAARFCAKMLCEIRSLGAGMMIIDQSPSALPQTVMVNTATKIAHRVGERQDQEAFASSMSLDSIAAEELLHLGVGECYFSHPPLHRPVRIKADHPALDAAWPPNKEVFEWIRGKEWFRKGRDIRKGVIVGAMEFLMDTLEKNISNVEKMTRKQKRPQNFDQIQTDYKETVKTAASKMEDLLGVAAMDRSLESEYSTLFEDHRKRMTSMLEKAAKTLPKRLNGRIKRSSQSADK